MIGELFSQNTFLWSCAWQSTACVALGLASSYLLRRRPGRAHQVLFLSMIAAVIVPIMSTLVKHYELGVFVAEPVVIQSQPKDWATASNYGAYGTMPIENIEHKPGPIEGNPAPVMAGSQSTEFPWRSVVLSVWITASLILATRLLVTFVLGVRLLGRATPLGCERIEKAAHLASAKLGIDKDVKVYSSRGVRSPVIWCWKRRPVLLVPSAAGRFDNGVDWAGVLCHELAHWKRRDHISGLLAELVVCILPWHPLVWWAKSRLVRFSEQACDDWVVASGQPCTDYAESLLDLTPGGQMAFVPAVVSSKRGLAGRVRRILQDKCSNPRTGTVWALTVSIMAVCLAVGVACAQTRPAKPASAPAQKKTTAAPTAKDKATATAALFQAIRDKNIELIKSAITRGANLEAEANYGHTPLHVAMSGRKAKIVKLLLEAGANPNSRDHNGQIPLHIGARYTHRHLALAEMLISKGADVNAKDKKGRTPAMIAFESGRFPMTDLLIAKGSELPPGIKAAYEGDLSRVQSLIENGKAQETFEQGLTLLHAAAAGGHTAIVELLLTNGLDVHSETEAGYTALHHAAAGNHREVAELLLSKGADINACRWTPLHKAVVEGHKDMVEFLLTKGANLNAKSKSGKTPLIWAVWYWYTDVAEVLVSHGADIHLKDEVSGDTPLSEAVYEGNMNMAEVLINTAGDMSATRWAPLHAAVSAGNRQRVEQLISKGVNINVRDDYSGLTALHRAAQRGHIDMVELLLAKGADIEARHDQRGTTALHSAAVRGRKEMVEFLIKKGANIEAKNGNGQTPLHLTAGYCNHPDFKNVIQLLLDKGADIETRGHVDTTPIHPAIARGRKEAAEILLANGADIHAISKYLGTPAHSAMSLNEKDMVRWAVSRGIEIPPMHLAAYFGEIDKVKSLIEKKADVNKKDVAKFTPLHCAVMGQSKEIVQLLIDRGANVKARNCGEATPLFTACQRGYLDIVQLLATNGAEIDSRELANWTPLHIAVNVGHLDVIEYLLAKGADIHAKCAWLDDGLTGITVLHLAARKGHVKVVEYLLAKGIDVNLKNGEGETALDLAKQKNQSEVVELLRKHGAKE